MSKEDIYTKTPSEFYKIRRPENFSDSTIKYESELTREHLAYEINQLTTNQKQDDFETLCRRLAEVFIAPNLIPQVGPTGGGDGKTDSETYPVSSSISDRWFIPENGWETDEKWAFAISAKKTWKSKAKSDVKKIVETKRGYTRVYFFTNQVPSSKKKKDAQDEFEKLFNLEIIILDGEWILEKIFSNKLIDLVVDSLSLSDIYKKKTTIIGKNDAERLAKLTAIEEKIANPKRYFEYDFQLVEDCLEAAVLSRQLEKPREEVEGKFDRAFRFAKKTNNDKQFLRLHYQRAWTYYNWYDDNASFVTEFKVFKTYISEKSSISEIELYFNLINLLRVALTTSVSGFSSETINLKDEKEGFLNALEIIKINDEKPCSALIAKTYNDFYQLMEAQLEGSETEAILQSLAKTMLASKGHIDFPFESFKNLIEEIGNLFPNDHNFDELIDTLASIAELRSSELSAGEMFVRRGSQKLLANYAKESVVYFGKSVLKLAKDETQYGFYLALLGLSQAYSALGLYWASNNCIITASWIPFKSWYENGILDERVFNCTKQLANNELIIGRLPSFLTWYELLNVLSTQIEQDDLDLQSIAFMDACLSVRLLNSEIKPNESLTFLPDLFNKNELLLSEDATLYKLGYVDKILENIDIPEIKEASDLDQWYEKLASQPFKDQMIGVTNLLDDNIKLSTVILGCEFHIFLDDNDTELLFSAEIILAYLESFFASSLDNINPITDVVDIYLTRNTNVELPIFSSSEDSYSYYIEINTIDVTIGNRDGYSNFLMQFISTILANCFIAESHKTFLENLFKREEVSERLSIILNHKTVSINILGDTPKLFFKSWVENKNLLKYKNLRSEPVEFTNTHVVKEGISSIDLNSTPHNKRKVYTVINDLLWNKALWNGFGVFGSYTDIGVFIAFTNENEGKKIFEEWLHKIGSDDKDDEIRICIIKGIDKNNPFHYRVSISSEIDKNKGGLEQIVILKSRFHTMTPDNSINLDNLIKGYSRFKRYSICPAGVSNSGKNINPFFSLRITKRKLYFKDAWTIGEQDQDRAVIKENDTPVIPKNEKNAPVLSLLKKNT